MGKSATPYHSALHEPPSGLPSQQSYIDGRVHAFQHDVLSDIELPPEFDQCDILYAEPPWQAGGHRFDERVGIHGRTNGQLWSRIVQIVYVSGKPAVLVAGAAEGAWLRNIRGVQTVRTKLNSAPAVAYLIRDPLPGIDPLLHADTSMTILRELAARYRVVGDFCCGYGRTGRVFVEAGGNAVLSDYNPQCIGYIAAHAGEWG